MYTICMPINMHFNAHDFLNVSLLLVELVGNTSDFLLFSISKFVIDTMI